MSYLTNIGKNNQVVNFFIRFGVRVEVDETWTEYDDGLNIWVTDWTEGYLNNMKILTGSGMSTITYIMANSYSDMTSASSSTNYRRNLWYDAQAGKLYMRFTGSDPNLTAFRFFAEKQFFVGSKHYGWHITPNDSASPLVQWQGVLTSEPTIVSSVNESIYGFLPAQSGSLTLANDDGYLDGILEGSLSNTEIKIFRCVGDVLTENASLAFLGFIRDASLSEGAVDIQYVDASSLLDNSVSNSLHVVNGVDPSIENAVIRDFYCGTFNRMAAVNWQYDEALSTSVNRIWNFGFPRNTTQLTIQANDANVGSNTTTRTYLDSVANLAIGDLFTRGNTTNPVYEVTAVGANYVDHTTLASAMGASEYFTKSFFQNIKIVERSTSAEFPVGADSLFQTGDSTITFNSSLESNISLPGNDLNSNEHIVVATVTCGSGTYLFPGESAALGSVNAATGFNQNPVQIIYELLHRAGFYDHEDFYDSASFLAVSAAIDINADILSPRVNNSFTRETYRQVISKICETALLKLYMKNGRWYISQVQPLGAADYTISNADVLSGFSYRLLVDDIVKEVTVRYDYGDVSLINTFTQDSWRTVNDENVGALALNNNEKDRVLDLYLTDQTDAETMLNRYLLLFSYPLGFLKLNFGLSQINISLDDTITIDTADFTGLPFTEDQSFSVVSIRETLDSIEVELFDQRGIEENAGDW